MFKNTIQKRVMGVIKARIQQAQKDFEQGVKDFRDARDHKKLQADVEYDTNVSTHADTLVSGLVGKFV